MQEQAMNQWHHNSSATLCYLSAGDVTPQNPRITKSCPGDSRLHLFIFQLSHWTTLNGCPNHRTWCQTNGLPLLHSNQLFLLTSLFLLRTPSVLNPWGSKLWNCLFPLPVPLLSPLLIAAGPILMLLIFFLINLFILFIFGCVGSSLLFAGFL